MNNIVLYKCGLVWRHIHCCNRRL